MPDLSIILRKIQEINGKNNKNMKNEIKINVPEGYEIDKENSTFECIKLKKIEKELPKTWEEFAKEWWPNGEECFISSDSVVCNFVKSDGSIIRGNLDRNILPNKETAEAMLALCQLIQLKDCYNDGWVPDWTDNSNKHIIFVLRNQIVKTCNRQTQRILAFKTEELRNEFFTNFRDLIETAKSLL